MSVFSTPGVSVCINQFYLPFVTGALEVLAVGDYWEDPDSVVPEIEKLIAALNEVAGDCAAPETPYCAAYDFNSDDHSEQWSGVVSCNGDAAPVYNGEFGGWYATGTSVATDFSYTPTMKFHTDTPITITDVEICYNVFDHSADTINSYCAWYTGTDVCDFSNYHQSGPQAPDFNGCVNVGGGPHTGTDFIFRVLLAPSSGHVASGQVVITGINIFGTGDAPAGGAICG